MSETGRDYSAIPRRVPPSPVSRLNRRTVIIAALVLLVLSGQLSLWVQHETRARAPVEDTLPLPPAPSTDLLVALPRTYADIPTPDVTPVPSRALAFPPSIQPLPTQQALLPLVPPTEAPTSPPPVTPPGSPAPVVHTPTPMPAAASGRSTPPPPKEPVKPKRWFSSATPPQGDLLTPPFPDDKPTAEGQGAGSSTLFPQAVWEKPADPTKVLYADQLVHGLLMQSLNSDIPGTVRVKVTEAVQDRFGQGTVLLPMDTTFLGRQEGRTQYGQARVPVTITMAILPNGTAIGWKNGQAGDATGAAGLPATVDNHYGKVILGAGLSALLNIGVRAPFGSAQSFQQSLPQEFAQDTAQSLGQSAQGVVRRELNVSPTLTVTYATPVTLSFAENVSFQTKPTMVHR